MSKVYTSSTYNTLKAAEKAAEKVFVETKGMFASLEGEVWLMKSGTSEFHVLLVRRGTTWDPSYDEFREAGRYVGLPILVEFPIQTLQIIVEGGVVKLRRYK